MIKSEITKVLIAAVAQLGERKTEDLKVRGSSPRGGIFLIFIFYHKHLYSLTYKHIIAAWLKKRKAAIPIAPRIRIKIL